MLRRLVAVREDETAALLWSFAYFFALMCGYYVLRPLREEAGIAGGVEKLPWMFTGTFLAMLGAVPLYSAVVARFPRRRIIPIVYRFFILNLLVFWLLSRLGVARPTVARVFYIWTSVFNLFAVAIFWSFMADLFSREQGKRLFGFIAAGGSAGGLLGPFLAATLAKPVGPANLLWISIVLLEVAVQCVHRLRPSGHHEQPVGGGIFAGISLVFSSPYLAAIAAQTLLTTITATFLYMTQARIVKAALSDPAARTALFAQIDLAVNVLSLISQTLVTGRVLSRIGLFAGLAVVPILNTFGSAALAAWPVVPVLFAVQMLRRTGHYAFERPSRDVLFTVVGAEAKYKSKGFLDAVVYRGGDAAGGWLFHGVYSLLAAIPIGAVWLVLVRFLARRANLPAHAAADVPEAGGGGDAD